MTYNNVRPTRALLPSGRGGRRRARCAVWDAGTVLSISPYMDRNTGNTARCLSKQLGGTTTQQRDRMKRVLNLAARLGITEAAPKVLADAGNFIILLEPYSIVARMPYALPKEDSDALRYPLTLPATSWTSPSSDARAGVWRNPWGVQVPLPTPSLSETGRRRRAACVFFR